MASVIYFLADKRGISLAAVRRMPAAEALNWLSYYDLDSYLNPPKNR
ncbi:hypothetical protein [Roseibacillus ishigakijimensis]|uniref:Uncharacterized protein n=1 Tax=Roseibacillus ishigakijimensis TaxID=454146 RepID=A0A934RVN6_9BACT|nr:hypothetical protein [Roseibacillus ishigakijimensis]MBK1835005.1 hypothetical protein [Roseibacillus ishigakijimensis]